MLKTVLVRCISLFNTGGDLQGLYVIYLVGRHEFGTE